MKFGEDHLAMCTHRQRCACTDRARSARLLWTKRLAQAVLDLRRSNEALLRAALADRRG